jgi:transposase InsO family protein
VPAWPSRRSPQRTGLVAGNAIMHTDRGSQYHSTAHRSALQRLEIRQSTSRTGSCLDGAVAESFCATIKAEIGAASLARSGIRALRRRDLDQTPQPTPPALRARLPEPSLSPKRLAGTHVNGSIGQKSVKDRADSTFYDQHRPHRTLGQAAPLRPLPENVVALDAFRVSRRDRAGGLLHEYRHVA